MTTSAFRLTSGVGTVRRGTGYRNALFALQSPGRMLPAHAALRCRQLYRKLTSCWHS